MTVENQKNISATQFLEQFKKDGMSEITRVLYSFNSNVINLVQIECK